MSRKANDSVENAVLTELYVRMINNQLNKIVYPAYLADLSYSLYRHGKGITFRIDGLQDRQPRLLEEIVFALKNPDFSDDQFSIVKDRLRRQLENAAKESPSNQTIHELYRLLMNPYWSESQRLDVLRDLSVDDLKAFVPLYYSKVKVRVLSHGDISQDDAIGQLQILEGLFSDSEFILEVENPTINVLDSGTVYLRNLEIDHSDTAISRYFQGRNNSREERAMMALLRHAVESPFYNQLRTVNRVGYLVHAGTLNIDRTPGLFFSVQSPSFGAKEVNDMYDDFLNSFRIGLDEFNDEEFGRIRSGLLNQVLQRDKNLSQRSSRYWTDIDRGEVMFDSRQRFAKAIEAIELEDLKTYFDNVIADGGQELLVQAPGATLEERVDAIGPEGYRPVSNAKDVLESLQ